MTVAKGRTNCEAERETIVQGFKDLIKVLVTAKSQTEEHIKAALYDIIQNKTLSDEERWTQMKPFDKLLSEQEEKDIRIRRTILIGLLSFWELSLKDICEYYSIDVSAETLAKPQKEGKPKKANEDYKVNDYVKAIFCSGQPDVVRLVCREIRELRNYMTHGRANKNRQKNIDGLISMHPEFCVVKTCGDYYIASYSGLENILKTVIEALKCAELTARTLNEEPK